VKVYLASPGTQQQAEHCEGMPVLLSFALYKPWMDRYQASYSRLLIDSGAFSELNSGVKVDIDEYMEWADRWHGHADAVAGLDDISGDWRRSMQNYIDFPGGFPTIHDTDPPELLADLVSMAMRRNHWLGIGLKPPRDGKERFVRCVCDNVPDGLHVHGWALRRYTHIRRLDSVDSTEWWRTAMAIRQKLPWLTYGEALAIVVKKYQRWQRIFKDERMEPTLFDTID